MDPYTQIQEAVNLAAETCRSADNAANKIARLLPGRLRKVDAATLASLKRELRQFNIHTGEWSNG